MKLLAAILVTAEARWKRPYGCDPAELEHYEITDDCKKTKGFNTEADENGVILEKKANWCRRQCKYGDLAPTTYVQCRCTKNYDTRTFDCSYKVKLVRDIWKQHGWVDFDFKLDGEYPVDRKGEGGRQAACTPPGTEGEWGEWSDWSACDGSCGLGESTRTRECSTDYCGEGETEQKRSCLSYDQYDWLWTHPCWHATSTGFYYGPSQNGISKNLNKGRYCVFPSFGQGWNEETIGDELVQIGVECEGEDTYNYETHSITKDGNRCKIVCRGSKGGEYLPMTSSYSNFHCLEPIPVQYVNPDAGYTKWVEQGLNGLEDRDVNQWYYNQQTWPRNCYPGCPNYKSLKELSQEFTKCYRIGEEPTCNGMPPRTQFEIDMGQTGEGNSYDCTDGDKPGSICTKSCINNHLEHIGNDKFVCKCQGEACSWERTDDYFVYVVYRERQLSCIQGCDAQPGTSFKRQNYVLDCSEENFDLTHHSTSNNDNAIIYQWNYPTPVRPDKKCKVTCAASGWVNGHPRDWMMDGWLDTGVSHFDIKCQSNSDGTFEWVNAAGGPMTECLPVCYNFSKGRDGDEVDPVWTCTKNNFPGSKCTKSCPDGYKLSDEGDNRWKNTSTKCQKKSWGTSWTENPGWFKPCVRE